jgi:hypothetical protein
VYNFFQTARSSSLFASISKIPIDARAQAGYVSSLAKNFAQLSLPFWLNLGALGQLWLFDFAKSPLVLLCAV